MITINRRKSVEGIYKFMIPVDDDVDNLHVETWEKI
jgi:hypothetical protein